MRVWGLMLLAALTGTLVPAQQSSPKPAVQQWRIKFFHDQNDSAIDFNELVTPAPGVVHAFGGLGEDGRRPRGVMVTSRDSGKTWQTLKLPDLPVSADFLDADNGWLVVRDAVHRTRDGGTTWKRAAKLKGVLRVKFLTAEKGFAVGYPKAVWRTNDGGVSWEKVPEAAQSVSRPENTTFATIDFQDAQRGLITGYSRPPRREAPTVPPWMDPDAQKPMTPNLMLVLETVDGGATWKPQTASAFGKVAKVAWGKRARGPVGLALVEFAGGFAYASEIVNLGDSKSAFRNKQFAIRDLAFDGGRMWAAGTTVTGKLNELPIPTKVAMLQSIDFVNWFEVPVDYRAVANRVRVAFRGAQGWLATDGGMILGWE